jgi:hypothetical protein
MGFRGQHDMLTRTVAILLVAGGVSLAATHSHAESALSIADRYIDKLKSSGKYGNFDLDKLRSEHKIGRFDLSKIRSETKIGGYDINSLSTSGLWQKSAKTSSLAGALPPKGKKTASLSSKASRVASRMGQ